MRRLFLALVVLSLPLAQLQCVGDDPVLARASDASTAADTEGGLPPPGSEAPLCEIQRGVCAGTKKTNDLYVNGNWLPCNDATYAPAALAACDDQDPCTIETVVGAPCDGVCGHAFQCPDKLTFDPVADGTLDKSQPTVNLGTTPELQAASSGSTQTKLAVLRFDPFAKGRTFSHVDRAFLWVPVHVTSSSFSSGSLNARLLKTQWSESVVTWSSGLQVEGSLSPLGTSTSSVLVFDVTEWVRAWNADPTQNNGIELSAVDARLGAGDVTATVPSRENPAGGGPKLEVIVNAHTVSLPTSEDTHLVQKQPTTNFGFDPQLTFTTDTTGAYTRVLTRYDLSKLPSGATVLYAEAVFRILSGTLLTWVAHAATQRWTENGVTWNTSPTSESALLGTLETGKDGRVSIELTGVLGRWLSNALPNEGILFKDDDEGTTGPSRTVAAGSGESKAPEVRPTLDVFYK
jgi:hypothetical protein